MDFNGFNLSEKERSYYSNLFNAIDTEHEGTITIEKALHFFQSAQLSPDTLDQIIKLCGAERRGHLGRSQFFLGLKLIGAAQCGLPVKLDVISPGLNMPLPQFVAVGPNEAVAKQSKMQLKHRKSSDEILIHSLNKNSNGNHQLGQLPPPPNKLSKRPNRQRESVPCSTSHHHASAQSIERNFSNSSSSSLDDLSQSPRPKNLIHGEKDWAAFHRSINPSDVDQKNWAEFDESHQLLCDDEVAEKVSSDDDGDVYKISDEQKEYYKRQFLSMQKDENSKMSGRVAKEFFEKSRLHVNELSKIWHISDIDKDGALSLDEFCIAMHLVVLKRNHVELPDVLPDSLAPKSDDMELNLANMKDKSDIVDDSALSPQSKTWTKFTDSPTHSTSVNSQNSAATGMQPVNFDFSAASIEGDPQIYHPVAVRVSPDAQSIPYSESFQCNMRMGSGPSETLSCAVQVNRPPQIPPPLPKRHARSSSLDLNKLGHQMKPAAGSCQTSPLAKTVSPNSQCGSNSFIVDGDEHKSAFKRVSHISASQTSMATLVEDIKQRYPLPAEISLPNSSNDKVELYECVKLQKERIVILENYYNMMANEIARVILDQH